VRRAALALAAVTLLALALMLPARPARGTPLWPGSRYTAQDRDSAIRRGMTFVYAVARNPRAFKSYGHDLVGMFAGIATTSNDSALRRVAWNMGRERGLEWRRLNPRVPARAGADLVGDLLFGSESCERLGVADPAFRGELARAAACFTATDYYGFDPVKEPPPSDVPEDCAGCGARNPRGAPACSRCGQALTFRSRYDVWLDAMIGTYTGERYGVVLGARYADVLKWLPAMRPYPARGDENYYDAVYAVTHLVYTLNDYSVYRLTPECFPEEFAFLKTNLKEAIALRDPEALGEYLDTLRAFGLTLSNPLLQTGIEYLLSTQNPDGSWDDMNWPDIYGRYHPTWTAIDGLREYRWEKALPCRTP